MSADGKAISNRHYHARDFRPITTLDAIMRIGRSTMTRNKTSTYKYLMAFGYLCTDINPYRRLCEKCKHKRRRQILRLDVKESP